MSNVYIERLHGNEAESSLLTQALDRLRRRIERRAYELYLQRDERCGSRLEDWLKAERKLVLAPDGELAANDGKIELRLAVQGFKAQELHVTACPKTVTVLGESIYRYDRNLNFCKLDHKTLLRRFNLPTSIDVDEVTATLDNKGVLHLIIAAAPKRERTQHEAAAAAS